MLFRLQRSPNKDAVLMALRLLIIRSVEMLSNADRKHRKAQSDVTHSVLLLTMALFSEVVDTVRRCTSNLQFASLFLEVGRQIEPSCLAHLFPLPLPGKKSEHVHEKQALTKSSVRSVLELFSLCIEAGSLAASASALPLLASRIQSRNYCDLLLARSIEAFVKNTDSGECTFDFTEEERRVIGDIFRFGMKLEDAAKIEAQLEKQDSEAEASKHDEVQASFTTDTMDSNSSTPNQASRNLICMSSRQGSILNYVMPSVFNDEKAEEEAISRAATSFIENNSDFRSLDFLALGDDEERELGEDSVSGPDSILKSVGGLVGDTLLELLRSPKTDCPWKTMFSLARLLIQGENQAASTSEVFVKAVDNAKIQHFDSLVPDCYAGGDDMERLVRFIVVDMAHSGHQLNVFEASLIVDLVLLLLQRLVDFPPEIHVNITAGLVAVALIAGHVSDRSPALMSTVDQDCFMYRIYERAVKDFESSA